MSTSTRVIRRSQRTNNKVKTEKSSQESKNVNTGEVAQPPKKKFRPSHSTTGTTMQDDDTISIANESRDKKDDEEEKPAAIKTENLTNNRPSSSPSRDQDESFQEREDDDDESAASHSSDDGDKDMPQRRRKSAESTKSAPRRRSTQNRTCPHCHKVISTTSGLRYHIDNFVCRKENAEAKPDVPSTTTKRKRGKSKAGGSQTKRSRGVPNARTCPKCHRVFTSEFGCSYHIKHKVCQTAHGSQETSTGLDPLPPGARFVTQFGVVEVVKDDRAQPCGSLPADIKSEARKYQAIKTRMEGTNAKLMEAIASNLRCRRDKINALYANKIVTKQSVLQIYFSGDPRIIRNGKSEIIFRPLPQDPALPPELCPDRIVECIMIPDQRRRFTSANAETPTDIRPGTLLFPSKSPTRLFLQRKLLKEPYVEEVATYSCGDCGRAFNTSAGLRYHENAKVCTQKQGADRQARTARQEKIEQAAQLLAEGASKLEDLVPQPLIAKGATRTRKGKKKKKESGMYPEVLLCLGYKVIKEDMVFTEDIKLPPPLVEVKNEGQEPVPCADKMDTDADGPPNWHEPGAILQSLKTQLKHHQHEYKRSAADQKHGTMYLGVFKALGYKRGKPGKKLLRASKRKRRSTKPPPPPKPAPPIIDTRALADEVDAGRYPSMKRYIEGHHTDICFICRDGGVLICCNFCRNAEHLKCIRTRFTVKDPEPEDDFMCHRCIQFILQRRNRAERRRLEKQQREEHRQQQEALEETKKNPGIRKGMEYPYLAARGQEITELVELLKDAQTRLEQSLATSKMNNIRRKAMGCFYSKK